MHLSEADIRVLKDAFEKLASWEEWEAFSARFFDWDNAPERPPESIEADLARESVHKDGHLWEPFAGNYDVDPAIETLYEELRQEIFKKLESEAHAENLRHPERYGRQCRRCRVFTRSDAKSCSFCGGALLPLPLNE